MKLKKLLYATLVVAASGALASCSSVLDKAPDGRTSLDDVFADNDKIAAYLQTIYSYMPQNNNCFYFWSRGPANWSDDSWDADELAVDWAPSSRIYVGNISPSWIPWVNNESQGNATDLWTQYWRKIHDCAYFLSRVDEAPITKETDRSRWRAEARLLRAYFYSMLLQWWGTGMPIVDDPMDYNDDFSAVKKASYYETVQFIVKDCDAAIACEDLPMRITSDTEANRLPKALAYAIKARMTLYAASPLYCEGENHWQEAYTANKEALNALRNAGYKLYDTMYDNDLFNGPQSYFGPARGYSNTFKKAAGLFNEYFCQTQSNEANPMDMETIYRSPHVGGNYFVEGIGATGQYKCGTCPSQELVDCFETTNGMTVLNLAQPYLDEETHLEPNYNTENTQYNQNNPYNNRDPRFYATVYYNSSRRYTWWPFAETQFSPENYPAAEGVRTRYIMTYVGEPQTGVSSTDRFRTRTGYYMRKFHTPREGADKARSAANQKFYRFAETLLNTAECAIHVGQDAEARSLINEVRARVNMPNLPESLTGEALLLRCKNERRVEFALEEMRFFDVRRWTEPDGDLSKTDHWITRMSITRVAAGSFTYKREPVSFERQCYSNKWLKYPLPLSEVNRMILLTGEDWQNPGW